MIGCNFPCFQFAWCLATLVFAVYLHLLWVHLFTQQGVSWSLPSCQAVFQCPCFVFSVQPPLCTYAIHLCPSLAPPQWTTVTCYLEFVRAYLLTLAAASSAIFGLASPGQALQGGPTPLAVRDLYCSGPWLVFFPLLQEEWGFIYPSLFGMLWAGRICYSSSITEDFCSLDRRTERVRLLLSWPAADFRAQTVLHGSVLWSSFSHE